LTPAFFFFLLTYLQSWFKTLVTFIPQKISYYAAYMLNGYPLDMCQYKRLFGTTRLPHESRDVVHTSPDSRHIAVALGGRFYRMDIVTEGGEAVSLAELEAQLRHLVQAHNAGELQQGAPNVGLFTTLERTRWAKLRGQLERSSAQNRESLASIDSALFMLCLDAEEEAEDHANAARLFLHSNGRNRWFDKSFSVLVTQNGKAAVNFEHSWGDGVSVLRYANEVHDEMTATPVWGNSSAEQVQRSALPTPLAFELDAGLQTEVKTVDAEFQAACKRLHFEVMTFDDFGKEKIKGWKISPDGLVQMAMQLAYHRLYHRLASTYESASTAGFLKGRTECIRPVSPDVVAFINAFSNPKAANEERQGSLRTAVDSHSASSLEAKIGKGMDRHLYALLCIAQQKKTADGKLPALFEDPAWTTLNHNVLSTSTLVRYAETEGWSCVCVCGVGVLHVVFSGTSSPSL
jgi:carnitine O-palmitoyltransferase 2